MIFSFLAFKKKRKEDYFSKANLGASVAEPSLQVIFASNPATALSIVPTVLYDVESSHFDKLISFISFGTSVYVSSLVYYQSLI